ncbi:MAG: hypothetical protein JW704_10030 [Anaerolineaceae bacterium]|nr:hypothetical protein [Anaerolineaceae bacterium]
MSTLKKRLSQEGHWLTSLPVVVYLVNVALLYTNFLPNLSDLNLWDEAVYINSGRLLIEGQIQQFASSPLVSLLYGVFYLIVQKSPFWMLLSDAIGRFVIFTLFYCGAYLVARELGKFASPLIMLGLLTVMPLVVEMYNFPSDPLFAALSAFTFWQVLRFFNTHQIKHIWLASLILGLAAATRNDGLVLLPVLVVAGLILYLPERRWWRVVVASVTPFLIIVGGYILCVGLVSGDFNPGIMERTYSNFEAGHEAISSNPGNTNATIQAYVEARRVFGTPEENGYSVIAAIKRNPDVYVSRLMAIIRTFPTILNNAYGIKYTVVLLLLAARGMIVLIKKKEIKLLLVMGLWVIPLAMGFINTIIRPGYLRFPFFILYALAGIGLYALVTHIDKLHEKICWVSVSILICVGSLITWKTAIFYGVFIFFLGLLVSIFINWRYQMEKYLTPILLLVFLCAGLILHGNYPGPKKWQFGVNGDEAASLFMSEYLPRDAVVLAGTPAAVWMSHHDYAGLNSADLHTFADDVDFAHWACLNFDAIYIDHSISPYFLEMIQNRIGKEFQRVFTAEEGDYQVLLTSLQEP